MLNTVTRVGKVLNLFTPERPEWGVTEVASTLELPKSNAHEMLSSLAHIGLLARTPSGRYRLGWRLLAMSRNLTETDGFQRQATRVVGNLAARVGEAAKVATWDGRYIVCVASAGQPQGPPLPERGPGLRLPGHATALGKVLMAYLPPEDVVGCVAAYGLPASTDRTIDSLDRLREQLDAARDDTVAFDREESHTGVACVAAPVRDAEARVIAALSISMSAERLRRAEPQFARAVTVAADRLSQMLVPVTV